MVEPAKSNAAHYDANYGNFESELYSEIRREAYGEDIGQNSWLTADEQDRFIEHLRLSPGKKLLDVACGAGGPALRVAAKTGCSIVGIDIHDQAIAAAKSLAAARGLSAVADFRIASATGRLPFTDCEFDAITCIDAINHLPERSATIREWARILRPGGRLLFTDPISVTGPLSNDEIAVRSAAGYFLFVPAAYDRDVISASGLRLLFSDDVTENTARIAEGRRLARETREVALRKLEGDAGFEQQQKFLSVAARLARERRLSRFVYVAERPVLTAREKGSAV